MTLIPQILEPPVPQRERWQPLRCGLLNLFRYDNQEFRFEDGHLLLRGNNGTGKSRVLALTLPFLFDGEVGGNRMEPDRDHHKRADWNLLMDKYPDRVGYTWLEFARLNEHGEAEYFTLGCGLSAVKGKPGVQKWFFITEKRVNVELDLQTPGGQVLGRRGLMDALGETGEVYTTLRNYRRAVDNRLFKLGEHRYGALVDLLIELRQPQLSRKFDERALSAALSEALPPMANNVVEDVAEAFRGLDQERDELERLQEVGVSVARFLGSYRRYAQIAARRRAERVRATHSTYEDAGRRLKAGEDRLFEINDLREKLEQRERMREHEVTAAETQVQTLRDSPEMRDAQSLNEAKRQAEMSREQYQRALEALDRAGKAKAERQRLRDEAAREYRVSGDAVENAVAGSREAARGAGLEDAHQTATAPLPLPEPGEPAAVDRAFSRLEKDIERRRQAIKHVEAANREVAGAEQELSRAKTSLTELSGQLDDAREAQRQAHDRRVKAGETLWESFVAWFDGLKELKPESPSDLEDDLRDWCEEGVGESPLQAAVQRARDGAVEHLTHERELVRTKLEGAKEQAAALREALRKLETGFHEPPPAPYPRDLDGRVDRPGAPLWRLCDFHESVDGATRAKIEAGLEAAGLLDAWVMPDGRLLDAGTHDTVVSPVGMHPPGSHLGRLLRPCIDGENPLASAVSADTVKAVLERIGLGRDQGQVWVSDSGDWRVGPLHGAWSKDEAQHIGESAREANRRRRMQELVEEIALVEAHIQQYEKALAVLLERRGTVDREFGAAPDHGPLVRIFAEIQAVARQVESLRARVVKAEAEVTRRRGIYDELRAKRDTDARELGVFDWIERLDDLRENLAAYDKNLSVLRQKLAHHRRLLESRERAIVDLEEAADHEQECKELRETREAEKSESESRLWSLEQTVGKTVEMLQAQLAEATTRLKDAREAVKRTYAEREELAVEKGHVEGAIARDQEKRAEADAARARAIASLSAVTLARLLGVADEKLADVPHGDWSPTFAVEIARRIEPLLEKVNADDNAWKNADNRIHQEIRPLSEALGFHDFEFFTERVDDVTMVLIPYQGRQCTVSELHVLLDEQLKNREELLNEREKEVLENHLIGEVTQHLHELLHEGEHLVENMNKELESRPTSSGMALRFGWVAAESAPPGFDDFRKCLLRNSGTWSASERKALTDFLQARIDAVREEDEGGSWSSHLTKALDYRKWHRFAFQIKQGAGWGPLTKSTHGKKSGGEKVIALILLQFAAAAAHYKSADPDAPRLILLDEAFVGVDDQMRGRCMALLKTFDLDFIMTSERERGCYESLPGVAICQLASLPEYDAVHVTRMVWNGKRIIRDPDMAAGG